MRYFADQLTALLPQCETYFGSAPWLILLEGDLGAGKTTWTQEFVEALGGLLFEVKSPTFLKVLTHPIPRWGTLLHLDAYRVEDSDEFLRMGLEAYGDVRGLVVEWPLMFLEFLQAHSEFSSLLGVKKFLRLRFGSEGEGRVVAAEWGTLGEII